MKKKKAIKQLQALGVQRNDAAGFIAAYRQIKAAGKEHLLPGVFMVPDMRFERNDYAVERFAVSIRQASPRFYQLNPPPDEYVHRQLVMEMGKGLLDAGLIKITKRALPADLWNRDGIVEYRATITVAKEEYA